MWLGWQSWHSPVRAAQSSDTAAYWTLRRRLLHTLRASLLNPHAIMDTLVVVGGGAAAYATPADKLAYALAAVLVSWVWFFAISLTGRGLGRLRDQTRTLRWVNRLSAVIMWTVAGRYLVKLSHALCQT
ncbi:MAG: LysE family transporter [Thermaerobacter sp.]|nr:LysE family transporter [Thermaerobacter sp.]